ncbi:hypothetical protein [Candidatus Nitrosocosmicus arcticus]|uniref:Uncharacterized protein n=1 Tax=Candidatus Nitrosocosmicus arcticus TaxID=2035267 RepID=A0A557SWT5_9ARCH|nr:hypothetical protein [Candidatus Nitrosocosmicus arcticus]TVP41066.1 conserved membrane protein of unknown function [Candidatus Nitrosocosmicus arcticus]
MKLITILSIAAAICTGLAGIFHLNMLPSNNTNSTILFLIGGLAQVFWIVPTVRRWGKIWDFMGIFGTAAFVLIWAITRLPDNPITGRGGRIGEMAVIIEVLQIVFIILLGLIIRLKFSKQGESNAK